MNKALSDAATASIHNPESRDPALVMPRARYWCSRFCRRVARRVYGSKFDHFFGASARETADRFKAAGLLLDAEAASVPGDLLFKLDAASGKSGHVAIRVEGNKVAENSSTKKGRINGALGFRTLEEFGRVTAIGRLPNK
jgi:hypothetical protein